MNITFLVSHGGGHFKFFYFLKKLNYIHNDVYISVIGDRQCPAIDFCIKNSINYEVIKYTKESNKGLIDAINSFSSDIIITTWNKIIDDKTLCVFPNKFYNLHYSLLPAFKGYTGVKPIEMAYNLNCMYVGSTVHEVTEDVDGGKIIAQFVMKKSGDFDQDVSDIFKNSCLLLLNTLNIISDYKILNLPRINLNTWQFSPSITFDLNIFNDKLWNEFRKYTV